MNLSNAAPVMSTAQASPSIRRKAWAVTAMLTAFMVLNFADKAVLGLVARPAMAELGLSPVQFGFIGSSFFFLFSLSAIVVGAISNRLSSRWLIFILSLIWACSQFPVLAGGGTVLLISRIVLGAGEGPALPAALHATHHWFPAEDRAFPSSLIAIGPTIGAAIAAPVLTAIIASPALGWRWAFVLLGAAGIVWGVVWALVGRDGPYRSGQGAASVSSTNSSATEKLADVPLRRVFFSKAWLFATAAGFACFWAQGVMTTWVPRYIGEVLQVSPARIGMIYALPWVFGTILLLVLGVVGQRLMRRGVTSRWAVAGLFGASLMASGVCLLLLPHARGGAAIALMTVGWGAFLVFPIAPTAIAYLVNPHQRAVVISSLVGCASVGGVIAPAVVGWFVEHANRSLTLGLQQSFSLTGALLLATGVGALGMVNPEAAREQLQRDALSRRAD